ncbi:hypothetical protein EDB80DRAFT_721127 [Ilyonectria destructans]|nr:hypothetical protein EDB80DRAFT_721127 [Ilyonectria destructans]
MSLITPQASRESTPAPELKGTVEDKEQDLLRQLAALRGQGDKAKGKSGSKTDRLRQQFDTSAKGPEEDNASERPTENAPDNAPANNAPATPVNAPANNTSATPVNTLANNAPAAPVNTLANNAPATPVNALAALSDDDDMDDQQQLEVPLTEAELSFLTKHCQSYFPHLSSLNKEAQNTFFGEVCAQFKGLHPDKDVFQLLCYGDFAVQTLGVGSGEAIAQFILDPPAWESMEWGDGHDALVLKKRREKAQELLEECRTGKAPVQSDNTDQESKPLSSAELEFLGSNAFEEHFTTLAHLGQAERATWVNEASEGFKGRHPHRDVFEYWFFAEFILQSNKSEDDKGKEILEFIHRPKEWGTIDWGNGDQDAAKLWRVRLGEARKALAKFRIRAGSEEDSDSEAALYNSEQRRAMRAKFHGKGIAEANRIVIEDPETGKDVVAEILGRHPLRKSWLALALPSNNDEYPNLSRGAYVDGAQGKYEDAFNRYVNEGANITLSVASNKQQLDGCKPEEFELNLVLVMPWGKGYRYAAYGIPHYKNERDFMVYSKALLASHKEWGLSSTMEVLHGHMIMAGQTIKGTGPKAIKAKSWRH